jgi:hypothetical protein
MRVRVQVKEKAFFGLVGAVIFSRRYHLSGGRCAQHVEPRKIFLVFNMYESTLKATLFIFIPMRAMASRTRHTSPHDI